jgi:hypothetical protein
LSVRCSPATCGLLTSALLIAGLPAHAALGPAGTFVNRTDAVLVLKFDGSQLPGNSFHLVESSKPGPAPAGPGLPAEVLAEDLVVLEPGQSVSLMQDFEGAAGAFAMAEFTFDVPGAAEGAMLPAKVTFSFDYPGKAGESKDQFLGGSVAMNVAFPETAEWAARYHFEPVPGAIHLKQKAAGAAAARAEGPLPVAYAPLPGEGAVKERDAWFRGYRAQAAQQEDPGAKMKREFLEKAKAKKKNQEQKDS